MQPTTTLATTKHQPRPQPRQPATTPLTIAATTTTPHHVFATTTTMLPTSPVTAAMRTDRTTTSIDRCWQT
ncbi:hypothetical protein BDZ89DRAFT_1059379 [Hymenopellis radicata]|nr:hypothetical protein BDZ89DRAFT_1059379 [Hymenopellis radicata]